MEIGDGYVGLLSFCSFIFSVIAAVMAIDLYALLRTGRSGSTWRVLIIASVMFALMHALRLAELLNFGVFPLAHLSEIVELMFVMAMAYAFYLQRKVFGPRERTGSPRPLEKPRAMPNAAEKSEPSSAQHVPSLASESRAQRADPALPDASAREAANEPDDEDEAAASEWARLNGQADSATRAQGGNS